MAISQEILDQAYPIIDRLAKSRSQRGAFAYYQPNDIYQEVWGMCLEAMERYDSQRGPIENYLNSHVSNRLKNLKRDNYFRPGSDASTSGLAKTRMNLVNALPLESGDVQEGGQLIGSPSMNVEPFEYLVCEETLTHVRSRLPDELVQSFDDLLGNNRVRSSVVDELRSVVADILRELKDDHQRT